MGAEAGVGCGKCALVGWGARDGRCPGLEGYLGWTGRVLKGLCDVGESNGIIIERARRVWFGAGGHGARAVAGTRVHSQGRLLRDSAVLVDGREAGAGGDGSLKLDG